MQTLSSENFIFLLDDLKRSNLLGSGSFADVFKLQEQYSSKLYAVKCFKKEATQDDINEEIKVYENAKTQNLSHPNIIQYYGTQSFDEPFGYEKSSNKLWILIFELGDGNLSNLLTQNNDIFSSNFELVKSFYQQIYSALFYLRLHKIGHRDLKPENIIFFRTKQNTYVFKIADFGIAKQVQRKTEMLSIKGNLPFGSPEQLKAFQEPNVFNFKSNIFKLDSYSFGLILVYLCLHQFPSNQDKSNEVGHNQRITQYLDQIVKNFKNYQVNQKEVEQFYSILKLLLCFDYDERIDILDIYLFSFYQLLDLEQINKIVQQWLQKNNVDI